jgi:hypothetical protein
VRRAGVQGQTVQEHLVERPRELGQVQADEIRVKKQGGRAGSFSFREWGCTMALKGGEFCPTRGLACPARSA